MKTHKKLPFSTCCYSFLKITCHYLLLIVGFDTLTYRKGYDRSPTLVGHQPPLVPLESFHILIAHCASIAWQSLLLTPYLPLSLP